MTLSVIHLIAVVLTSFSGAGRADEISGTATGNATVQVAGPRTGTAGTNFLNVESNSNGNFADFGVVDFAASTFNLAFPVLSVSNLNLRLTQSNAAFTLAGGTLNFYLSRDTTTGIAAGSSPLVYQSANAPEGIGTQLAPLFLLGSGSFTGVNGTNAVDNYALSLSGSAESYFINQLNSSGTNLIRLVITPTNGALSSDPKYAATWIGATNSTVGSRPTLSFSAVLDQPSLVWQGGSGIWNNTNSNWLSGSTPAMWNPSQRAIFNTPNGSVTLGEAVTTTGMQFNASGYTISGTGSLTLSNANSGSVIQVSNASDIATISGTISGVSGLVKTGPGRLALTGTNDFFGDVKIQGGALAIGRDESLGFAGNGIVLNSGTFLVSATNLIVNSSRILSGAGAIDTGAGHDVTFSGGASVTTLSVTNPGRVIIPSTASATFSTLSLSAGSTMLMQGGFSGPSSAYLTVNGDGTFIIAGDQSFFTQGLQTARGAGANGPNIVLAGSLPNRGLGTTTFRLNAGTLSSLTNLTGTNAIATHVSLGGNAGVGGSAPIELAGGLDLFGNVLKILNIDNHTTISGPLTVTGTGNSTLVKTGTGILSLTSTANSFGATIVSAGTLEVGPLGFLGTGSVTVNASSLENVRLVLQTHTGIDDLASVILTTNNGFFGQLDLQFDNALLEKVDSLVINGTAQQPGIYSAANLPNFLTGTGRLQVTSVPEPSTAACLAAGLLGGLLWRARRRGDQ